MVMKTGLRAEMRFVWKADHLPPLNCASCKKCCIGDTVKLLPDEDASRWKTKLVEGRRVLAKGKDGNCVYLGKNGCRIQNDKPLACQLYDCRIAFELSTKPDKQHLVDPSHPATQQGREWYAEHTRASDVSA